MKQHSKRSSEILMELVEDKNLHTTLSYNQIFQALGNGRSFGTLILFFAIPSILPFSVIPGISFIFSIPIMVFALQMIFGRNTPWLPKKLAEQTVSFEKINKMIRKIIPYLQKIEWLLTPRLEFMASKTMLIFNGVIILFLAILLTLPIPLSNFIISFFLIMISLGMTEKDGVFILFGYLGTICYVAFIYLFLFVAIKNLFF